MDIAAATRLAQPQPLAGAAKPSPDGVDGFAAAVDAVLTPLNVVAPTNALTNAPASVPARAADAGAAATPALAGPPLDMAPHALETVDPAPDAAPGAKQPRREPCLLQPKVVAAPAAPMPPVPDKNAVSGRLPPGADVSRPRPLDAKPVARSSPADPVAQPVAAVPLPRAASLPVDAEAASPSEDVAPADTQEAAPVVADARLAVPTPVHVPITPPPGTPAFVPQDRSPNTPAGQSGEDARTLAPAASRRTATRAFGGATVAPDRTTADGDTPSFALPSDRNDARPAPASSFGAELPRPSAAPAPPSPPPSPAIASPHPIVAAQPGRIGHELGVEIARQVAAGGDELFVRLSPAELGRIEVRMSFDDRGGLTTVFAADSAVALDLLRRDSADLSRALNDAGFRSDMNSLRFDAGDRGGFDRGGGQPRTPWPSTPTTSGNRSTANDTDASDQPAYRSFQTRGRYNLMA